MYRKLFNNSLIFAIGNLGSKFIIFLLLPIYTSQLTKDEFGLVDLITSTLGLLLPLLTLSIFDAVFRFVMDKNYDKQSVLTNSLIVFFIGSLVSILIYPIFLILLPFDEYLIFFYILFFSQALNAILSQYVRANGNVKLFAINGLLNATFLLISNIVLLIIFNQGIIGYLFSLIVANLASNILLLFISDAIKNIKIKKINYNLIRELLLYSLPLVPNSIMWWVMSLSDRYLIVYLVGMAANGLYAVANKIPSILTVLNTIFFQAWQMSAIEESNLEEKDKLFSEVFTIFGAIMLMGTSFLLIFLKSIIDLIVDIEYYSSWEYVPYLLLGVVFSSFSGFLGTNYIVAKKTSGIFITSFIGALINIILNLVLIPWLGVIGASISTMFSFFTIWLLRIHNTRKYVNIKVSFKKIPLALIVLNVQILLMYPGLPYEVVLQLISFITIILIFLSEVLKILNKIATMFIRKINAKNDC